ncbi:hypothetical protein F4818DRAFT_30109 [Hypoxylon cercidicola]|nr:hypothetical protein F4818DRAFT_30109 [Hypoxylon cercidicola]
MAPELRKRKTKETAISAAKPATKAKADIAATKRKAPDDASPIAAKKSKKTKEDGRSKKVKATEKKASKSRRSTDGGENDDDGANGDMDNAQASDDEDENAQALAKVVDSDEEDGAVVDADVAFHEGQDVGEIPKASKKLLKSANSEDGERGVVYVGRLPHGFYEHEMRSYFSQFGKVERLRMSRNKKTGASRHFAFIEFASAAVAEIVVKTMDNYLLFGRVLKVKVVPKSQIHEDLWKGANRRFKKVPWNKMAGNQLKKPLSESTWTQKISREEQKRNQRAKKLQDMDYDFEVPKIKSVDEVAKEPATLEGAEDEAPKAIEAAPEAVTAESPAVEEEAKDGGDKSADAELAAKEPTKTSKQDAPKPSKKGKKSKTKKAVK